MTLIERLSAATGPSRELDAEISEAVYPFLRDCQRDGEGWFSGEHGKLRCEDYTASIDSALTLVPEGWTVGGLRQADNKMWSAELREGYATSYKRVVIEPSGNGYRGTTLALAICIAALRAREAA